MKDRFPEDESRWLREVKLLFRGYIHIWHEDTARRQGVFESWDEFVHGEFHKYAGPKTSDALLRKVPYGNETSPDDLDHRVRGFQRLLEMMGEKSSEMHICRVDWLTSAFNAKAFRYKQVV